MAGDINGTVLRADQESGEQILLELAKRAASGYLGFQYTRLADAKVPAWQSANGATV
jgi:hypothetical protein